MHSKVLQGLFWNKSKRDLKNNLILLLQDALTENDEQTLIVIILTW